MVKEVWVWLGEGRTLEGTDFSVMWTEVVGTEEEGWQVALWQWDWGYGGVEAGPRTAGLGPVWKTLGTGGQVCSLWDHILSRESGWRPTGQASVSDRSPRSVSYHWGVRAGLLFCKLSFQHPSANPGNVVPGPATQPGPRETLNSEAKGGNRPPPVCPVGPSSHLLPRLNPAWGVRLDTFQVRPHVSGFGGTRGSCPRAPQTPCSFGVPRSRCYSPSGSRGSCMCATVTWAQTHRLRYKDKYKYYSQNLCINIFGEAWMISSSGRLFLEQ